MYINREDINNIIDEKTLIQLTNDDAKATETFEPKIISVIEYVNNFIDDSLRGSYNLPLSSIPNTLIEAGKQIAKYKLFELRDKNNERTEKSYNNAISIISQYRDGKILLEEYNPTQPILSSVVKINSRTKVFNNL